MTRILCVGHAVQDHIFQVPELPAKAAKHRASGLEIVGGGPAANAAVAISRLGGTAMLAARVGDDATGASIIRELEQEGVDCTLVKRFAARTSSQSAVMVDSQGQRMIVNYFDPDYPSAPDWLLEALPETVNGVLADTRWPQGARAALEQARQWGVPGILDADNPMAEDKPLFSLASHTAFSAEGLGNYLRRTDKQMRLEDALLETAREAGCWCCMTDGADGVHIAGADGLSHLPAPQVQAVDTLAAGDIWHGAFALALAEGQDERASVRFANAVAALKVTRPGGRKGAPNRREVDDFIEKNRQMEKRA